MTSNYLILMGEDEEKHSGILRRPVQTYAKRQGNLSSLSCARYLGAVRGERVENVSGNTYEIVGDPCANILWLCDLATRFRGELQASDSAGKTVQRWR